jgi:phage/plasmid-like protein (TIGR03299 family)
MAHQIESMFYVGETPWHGLGNKLTSAPTVEEAIKQAGLDWAVHTRPIFLADGREVPAMATVRATDGTILGVVGQRYQPLQNKDAFQWFDPLVSNGLVDLETAGSLNDGKRVWILARITQGSDLGIVGEDVIRKFILLSNSHDGTLAVRVGFVPIRVVCANTLAMAHDNAQSTLIRLKHSKAIVKNLEGLREIINVANQSFEATAEQFRLLASKQINVKDLHNYVKVVLGHEKTEDADLSSRAENSIQNVIQLFETGRGNTLPGVKGTVWAAYNAVTEYLTHDANDNADKRYNSLWFGGNAARNKTALERAVEYAKAA